jgi:hypothetical protein
MVGIASARETPSFNNRWTSRLYRISEASDSLKGR